MFGFIVLESRIEYAHLVVLEKAPLCLWGSQVPRFLFWFFIFYNNNITFFFKKLIIIFLVLCCDGGFLALQVMNSSGSELIFGIFHVKFLWVFYFIFLFGVESRFFRSLNKSINIGGAKNLPSWHHKNYFIYFSTFTKHPTTVVYFSIQHNKII